MIRVWIRDRKFVFLYANLNTMRANGHYNINNNKKLEHAKSTALALSTVYRPGPLETKRWSKLVIWVLRVRHHESIA